MAGKNNEAAKKPQRRITAGPDWTIDPEIRAEIKSRVDEARVSGAQARFLAVQATALVLEHGCIGAGRMYASQADYARALGVDKSTVTQLKTLTVAVKCGLTPEHDDWGVVSSEASRLGEVARDKRPSVAKFIKAAKAAKAARGKGDGKGRAVKSAEERATERAAIRAAEVAAEVDARVVGVWTAVDYVRDHVATLDQTDARTLVNSLTTLLAEAQAHLKVAPVRETDKETTAPRGPRTAPKPRDPRPARGARRKGA